MTALATAVQVLGFWFDETSAEQRFARDDSVDATIRERFGALHAALSVSVPEDWRADGKTVLAAVIVLDQFSRNLYRDDANAFVNDDAALALAREAIARNLDAALSSEERQFLVMPFMHSEILANVEHSIALMHAAGSAQGEDFARRHADVIARFGRYPARNEALGREKTPEEARFMAEHSMGF